MSPSRSPSTRATFRVSSQNPFPTISSAPRMSATPVSTPGESIRRSSSSIRASSEAVASLVAPSIVSSAVDEERIQHVLKDLHENPTGFRFNGHRFLVTFNDCPGLSIDTVQHALATSWPKTKGFKIRCDGDPITGWRYTILVLFQAKERSRNPRLLDIGIHRPRIQSIHGSHKAFLLIYRFVSSGPETVGDMAINIDQSSEDDVWRTLYNSRDVGLSVEQVDIMMWEHDPKRFANNHINLTHFSAHRFGDCITRQPLKLQARYNFDDDKLPHSLIEWRETQFKGADRPKSLILVGPTRIGKSQWARSLHDGVAYMEGMFNATLFKMKTSYLVFSDFPRHKDGREWVFEKHKHFFGAQDVVVITDKYVPKMQFNWSKPFIYLCNELPQRWRDDVWLKGNSVIIDLEGPLF